MRHYLASFALGICALLSVQASADAQSIPEAWFRPAVGTWEVKLPQGSVEIAIWERQLRADAPEQSAFTVYHGIARSSDGACAYRFEDARNGLPSRYPEKQNASDVHVRAYFGFRIRPENWITKFRVPSDPEPQYSTRVPSTMKAHAEWAKRIDARSRACYSRLSAFYVYPKAPGGPWVAEAKASSLNLSKTDGKSSYPLKKVAASSGMQALIKDYKTAYATSAYKRARTPSARDMAVILNPAADPGPSPSLNSQCNQRRMAAAYRLATQTPYAKLEARPVDDETIALTQHTPDIYTRSIPEKKIVYYPRDAGLDWDALSLIGASGGSPQAVCAASEVLHTYLDRVQAGTLIAKDSPPSNISALDTYDALYMVDRHGVGRISISKSFMGQSFITRVFGSSSSFAPGDKTHIINETPATGSFTMIPNIKDVVTGEITSAAGLTMPDTVKVAYDSVASDWLKIKAYTGKIDPREPTICAGWRGKVSRQTCAQHVNAADRTKEVYLLNNKETAIGLFKNMSPDPQTWAETLSEDTCESGPFCGPNGSRLLRAIYLGDDDSVRDIEEKLIPKQRDVLLDYYKLFGADENDRVTVLNHLIDEYMYEYQNRPKACFNPGAKTMIFERTTNTITLENGFGQVVDQFGGMELYGRYDINKEFVPICQKYCDVREASVVASLIGAVFDGPDYSKEVGKMLAFSRENACGSVQVKRFERNFLEIFKNVHPGSFKDRIQFQASWY